MAHTSEKRWANYRVGNSTFEGVSLVAAPLLKELIQKIILVEEAYQQMQEIYTYAGGTATDLAELLFKDDIEARSSPNNVASQEEIDKATDLINAMQAAHQLYEAANNVAVAQSDRLTPMRRMI